jgi:pimeloyl-ACP methyl ester carboxylesterase
MRRRRLRSRGLALAMRHDGSHAPPDYASAFTASFVGAFLDAVVAERAVVGNSLGGLLALHLAFSEPARVSDLVLADSVGLGEW